MSDSDPILEYLEKQGEEFVRTLSENGADPEAIQARHGHLKLFLLHYVHGQARRPLAEIGGREVIDFVGTWYIRNVENAREDSILSILLSTTLPCLDWVYLRSFENLIHLPRCNSYTPVFSLLLRP